MFIEGLQPPSSAHGFEGRLRITGLESGRERELSFDECLAFPKPHQVADVGELVRGRRGCALRLRALFDALRPARTAQHVILTAADAFEAPLILLIREVGEHGLLVYGRDGKPLSLWQGGPFHLILPGFPYGAADVPKLVALEFAEAPSIAEARSRSADSRTPLAFLQREARGYTVPPLPAPRPATGAAAS